jgi:hypothetical protein
MDERAQPPGQGRGVDEDVVTSMLAATAQRS